MLSCIKTILKFITVSLFKFIKNVADKSRGTETVKLQKDYELWYSNVHYWFWLMFNSLDITVEWVDYQIDTHTTIT